MSKEQDTNTDILSELSPYTRILLEEEFKDVQETIVEDIVSGSICSDEAIIKALVKGVQIGMSDSVMSEKIMSLDIRIQAAIDIRWQTNVNNNKEN
jgi:hypothetical protein